MPEIDVKAYILHGFFEIEILFLLQGFTIGRFPA